MTIFKAFLQILKKNLWILLLYTGILVIFSVFSLDANQSNLSFTATKPDLYLDNQDPDSEFSQGLASFLAERNHLVTLPAEPDALQDAIFYRQVNYAVTIPASFGASFLAGQNPALIVQSTGDYNAALAEMNLERFLDTAQSFRLVDHDEATLLRDVQSALATEIPVELAAKRDLNGLERAAFYYNFLNYPLIVGCIFMICTVMLSFRDPKIARRITVSGVHPTAVNRTLLVANSIFGFLLWLTYVLVSLVVVGAPMFSLHGCWFILNSFVFAFAITALALLLANLIRSRNAINGLTNVIGLGTSFLCGAFVPLVWLPDSVRLIAHALPSYWYIDANERIKLLETFSWPDLFPILLHMLVVLGFALGFILLTNFLSRRARQQTA